MVMVMEVIITTMTTTITAETTMKHTIFFLSKERFKLL